MEPKSNSPRTEPVELTDEDLEAAAGAAKRPAPANSWHGHFEPKRVPEGVWMRCDGCQATLFRKEVERNLNVCPECQHHFRLSAAERIFALRSV